ncbi:hypothetical protein JMJ77_0012696 [Colletotrichum scovillei]|uniref:Uncharacterized protein n=1 Tax=Colletotrichum scovillei TaxID=1209932 RepID=A0A9P7UC16_9PEZI|nr:hypothetical protein JMJ77_0012696 [Colletotrichum scovillei]KAG7072928.1 hypothetical protein JMJ78_0013913 [Colletotrichum scovillei]
MEMEEYGQFGGVPERLARRERGETALDRRRYAVSVLLTALLPTISEWTGQTLSPLPVTSWHQLRRGDCSKVEGMACTLHPRGNNDSS